jgi:L-iditol 2-dehydrogenase
MAERSPDYNEMMTAAVYRRPGDLDVEERTVPDVGPEEALLRVSAAGICGTDLRIVHGQHRQYPSGVTRVPGHEAAGDIVEVGADVPGLTVGDRVFVAPNIGCGHCRQCTTGNVNRCPSWEAIGVTMDGAFAEYVRIPSAAIRQGNLIPIDKDTDPAVAALIEPFACVVRGQRAVGIRPGDVVLVIGAGPIGVMHVMLASIQGAAHIISSEYIAQRLAQAERAGADTVVDPQVENLAAVVDDVTRGAGADVVIVAAPAHAAQAEALELAAIGGRVNFFAGLPKDQPTVELDSNLIHYKELIVTGTTGSTNEVCRRAAALLSTGRIDLASLVTARFPLPQANEAFRVAEARQSMKVVFEPAAREGGANCSRTS